jgi:signal transduction histidine kinase
VARAAEEQVVTGPGRPNIEFRYSAISLSAPQHLTFRYRLDKFDQDWVEAGTRRVAYYPRLPPGQYRFSVRAANRDGVWSEAGAPVRLRVTAPLWATRWFQLLVLASLAGLAALVARRRVQAARLRRAAQEEFSRRLIESQEHERKRIAGELHDGLGQELLVVKNRALLALAAQGLPGPARQQLDHISQIVSQSLDSVRDLAHNLTPYQLEHLGLSEALRTMVASVAAGVDIVFDAAIEDIDGQLSKDQEINLYRIVQEAVSNVVRHSGAANASVRIARAPDGLIVTVTDDGQGFRVRADGGGFGLSGIAERVRILGGRLSVLSEPGQGTCLTIIAPAGPARAERP